jgi:hypothetical protein
MSWRECEECGDGFTDEGGSPDYDTCLDCWEHPNGTDDDDNDRKEDEDKE